jgi:hypothetical protein
MGVQSTLRLVSTRRVRRPPLAQPLTLPTRARCKVRVATSGPIHHNMSAPHTQSTEILQHKLTILTVFTNNNLNGCSLGITSLHIRYPTRFSCMSRPAPASCTAAWRMSSQCGSEGRTEVGERRKQWRARMRFVRREDFARVRVLVIDQECAQ